MRCPSCGFENMPGRDACGRCGAQLVASGEHAAEEFMPARAGAGKRLRPFGYWLNRVLDGRPRGAYLRLARFLRGSSRIPGVSMAAMLLSVLPGLGHLLSGRRRAALVAAGVWLLAVFVTANFYTGAPRQVLVGLLVAWHAGVVFHAGRVWRTTPAAFDRVRVMLLVLVIATAAYLGVDAVARSHVRFVPTPYAIASLDMREGDVLTFRPNRGTLRRGDVCLVVDTLYRGVHNVGGGYVDFRIVDGMVIRLIALPGDTVEVSADGVKVNGEFLDAGDMPGRGIPLPEEPVSVTVPEKSVLAVWSVRLAYEGNLRRLASGIWRRMYVVPVSHVAWRATGVYLPLTRRRSFGKAMRLD